MPPRGLGKLVKKLAKLVKAVPCVRIPVRVLALREQVEQVRHMAGKVLLPGFEPESQA